MKLSLVFPDRRIWSRLNADIDQFDESHTRWCFLRGNHRDLGVTWLTLPAGASITDRATRLQDFRRNAIVCNWSLCGLSRSKVAISTAVADRQCVGKISRSQPRHAPTPICRARTSPTSSLKTHTSVPSLGAVAIGSYLPRSTMGRHPLGLIGLLIYGLPIRPFNGSNWSGAGYPSGKY